MQPSIVPPPKSAQNPYSQEQEQEQEQAQVMSGALCTCLQQVAVILNTLQVLPQGRGEAYFVKLNVGKHFRHIFDHFLTVQKGLSSNIIDYNLRNRGELLEVDIAASVKQLDLLLVWCKTIPQYASVLDRAVGVESEVDCLQHSSLPFASTFSRELLYLINHTIHHVAYVKLLLSTEDVVLPATIGLAPCTATLERGALK